MLTDLNKIDQDMKVSDSQVPCQQLFTLSLDKEQTIAQLWIILQCCDCLWTHCPVQHLVVHLNVVTDYASRNLSDSLFKLCHQYFVEYQEGLPEEKEKTMDEWEKKENALHIYPRVSLHFTLGKLGDELIYLFRVGHDEELSSFPALRSSRIPSPAISSTAFRISSACSR